MKRFLVGVIFCCSCGQIFAQVDIAHRRILMLQSGIDVYRGEEDLNGYGYYWFNENHFPWDQTALRVNFAGVYIDSELSYFLPEDPATAIGLRLGGGAFSDDVKAYVNGERLERQSYYGDSALGSVFVNHEILKIMDKIPLNVRGTYEVRGTQYRDASYTKQFELPSRFYTQSGIVEIRLGGMKREITAREGLIAYLRADTNYRTNFEPFGPDGDLFPTYTQYQRLLGQLGARIPIHETTWMLLLTGGAGRHLDELSAWRLGGNLINADPTIYTLHGYYTKEFFVRDFGLANFSVSQLINERHNVTLNLYADYAVERAVPPDQPNWRSLPGVGAGVGFRTFWGVDVLISYGYGFEAIRNGDRGGQEVAIALQKQF